MASSLIEQIRLYDPKRPPKGWTAIIRPGQLAVFHSDPATDVEKKADGQFLASDEDSTCLVSDAIAEAEAYCEAKVEEAPSLRCDVITRIDDSISRPTRSSIPAILEFWQSHTVPLPLSAVGRFKII